VPILSNREVNRLESVGRFDSVKSAIRQPIAWLRACGLWVWSIGRDRSPEKLRADDQARQSRVRRELRGLPPEHVQPAHVEPAKQ
jgi:hypothetical protein